MDDPHIHGAIEELVAEEHELWQRESTGQASEADRRRLDEIRISLDRCWDLLRQRRARRDADKTLTPPRRARPKSLSATSSSARR